MNDVFKPDTVCDQICVQALKTGHKILICGNGGSAAMAAHFAAELVVRYAKNRAALPCINLAGDPAILTAIGNDLGYDWTFARQVRAFGKDGDVLIALSTSGKSANVLKAIEVARILGLSVIEAPRNPGSVAVCQEMQLTWIHWLARRIEEAFV